MVYDWLLGAFPRDIVPTDIDGEIEVGGRFLRLEFKHEAAIRNGIRPSGQLTAFLRVAKTGFFTVLFVGTNDRYEPTCFVPIKSNGEMAPLRETNKDQLREFCHQWAQWAERNPSSIVVDIMPPL